MRKPIIAGNWKMNNTPEESVALVKALAPLVADAKCEVVVCPTAACLAAVGEAITGTNIVLGAQNVHYEEKGAYTGEISASMLKALGVKYVIIGHSERRQYFGETDETVNKRARAALAAGLVPIICVGESLSQREKGVTREIVSMQTKLALADMSAAEVASLVIAYEPIWAIGTGKTATDDEANETIGDIRAAVKEAFGAEPADAVSIQFGGSMNPKNVAGLMAKSEIDGGLIGGASLKAKDFSEVVNY